MPRFKPWKSVVTRLITALVVGGVVVSIALSVLEYQRATTSRRMDLTQRIALTTHNLQSVLAGLLDDPRREELANALAIFTADQPIEAVQLTGPGLETLQRGNWPEQIDETTPDWSLTEQSATTGEEVALDRRTLIHAPFTRGDTAYRLSLIVDGPAAQAQMRQQIIQRMAMQWLLLAVMLLLGLLLVRRWFTGPLSEIVEMIDQHAGPDAFRRVARQHQGEFGSLAATIADMLERLDTTSAQLAQRERAFEHLYDFAPAAMISLDPVGQVVEANRRAAALLGVETPKSLKGRDGMSFILAEDRPLLQEAIDRLAVQETTYCELRLAAPSGAVGADDEAQSVYTDVAVEAVAVRDADGVLIAVRLSLLDVSRSRQLQRQLEDQTRLLNLIIDHMSDAILLVDANGRVAATNRKLTELLQCRPESLIGSEYSHDQFWDALGVPDRTLFVNRLRQIEAEPDRPAQERFETRAGVFLFRGMPLHDAAKTPVGRLWVVQETTPQEQHARLLHQQHEQLGALKHVGEALARAGTVDAVLQCATEHLFNLLGVEAVGLALRHRSSQRRCKQIVHRGFQAHLLQQNQGLTDTVQRHLLPLVLHNDDVAYWPDPPRDTLWGRGIEEAGLTCLAAGPLRGPHETVGIVWVGRRGGERLERYQIHLLQTLIPTIAARLHIVELEHRLRSLALADMGTGLPSREPFDRAVQQAVQMEQPFGVLVMDLYRAERAAERGGGEESGAASDSPVQDDAVIEVLAERLQMRSRRSALLARLDRHRLGMIVPGADPATLVQLGQRLQEAVTEAPVGGAGRSPIRVTARLGIACYPEHGCAAEVLCERAIAQTEAVPEASRLREQGDEPATPRRQVG